jgi:trk system potassium uptake protein TrkA
VRGDGCDFGTLKAAGLERADVVAAVTGDDEDNLVISLLAKQEFARAARRGPCQQPEERVDVQRDVGCRRVGQHPAPHHGPRAGGRVVGSFVRLLSFEGGKAKLAEVTLAADSPAAGKEIVEIGSLATPPWWQCCATSGGRAARRHHSAPSR